MSAYFPEIASHASNYVYAKPNQSALSTCCVINCANTSKKRPDLKFYPFPEEETEQVIWSCLLGRVTTTNRAWRPSPDDKESGVCSEHFLGNRRLLLPSTDYYFPSIFPEISEDDCQPNLSKRARFSRPKGYYKHKKSINSDGRASIVIVRTEPPDPDGEGITWEELEDLAFREIYLPFTTAFNKMYDNISMQYASGRVQLNVFRKKHEQLRKQLEHALQLNAVAPTEKQDEQKVDYSIELPAISTDHSVFTDSINLNMPSIVKNYELTKLQFLKRFQQVLVRESNTINEWMEAIVEEVDYNVGVVFVTLNDISKKFPLGNVAYGTPAEKQIQLGTRVVTRFLEIDKMSAGVVMEYPKWHNKHHYLIISEEGHWQYSEPSTVHLLCKQTSQPWLHVSRFISAFVKDYFHTTERALLRVSIGQVIQAKRDNQLFDAKVLMTEGNLIQLEFYHYGEPFATEWIYAGSTRLHDIQNHLKQNLNKMGHKIARRRTTGKGQPYIEFAEDTNDVIEVSDDEDMYLDAQKKKNTARKSTVHRSPLMPHNRRILRSHKDMDLGFVGKTVIIQRPCASERKKFVAHECGTECLKVKIPALSITKFSPYILPEIEGFNRVQSDRGVTYFAPCGKKLKNLEEVLQYLIVTKSKITIDHFCFDHGLNILATWEPTSSNIFQDDITNGAEPYPISAVNSVDHLPFDRVPYFATRRPTKLVRKVMMLDTAFLPCCSCTDDCLDKSRCECQQQTVAASDALDGVRDEDAGYKFRSLNSHTLTGIFECNVMCPCSKKCINRVVQNGVQLRLQLFKTQNKGFGVRTLHDIPKGRFICTYAGTILSDKEAEQIARDVYFAELDYMDVCAENKDGYESSATDIEDDLDEEGYETVATGKSDEGKQEKNEKKIDGYALRKLYFGKEESYVMDAMDGGNIGRYFNHSCEPNIFVQNVFVDTHDLRFPWIAFFSDRLIQAGEELTWDYRYEVGSVVGRRLLCYCGTKSCRKRLL